MHRDTPTPTQITSAITTPPAPLLWSDVNAFKFNLDAVDQVGLGVMIGGGKSVHVQSHKPTSSFAYVYDKLTALLAHQENAILSSQN